MKTDELDISEKATLDSIRNGTAKRTSRVVFVGALIVFPLLIIQVGLLPFTKASSTKLWHALFLGMTIGINFGAIIWYRSQSSLIRVVRKLDRNLE